MNRYIIICLLLAPTISHAQWPASAKKLMENALFRGLDQSFIIDSVGKEVMVECMLSNYEATFPDFEKFRKTPLDSLNVFESKLRLTCISQNQSSLKIFYTRWEAINNLTKSNLKNAYEMVGLTTPAFKKLPASVKEYSVIRMFEIAKFYYPIGMPLAFTPDIKKKMVDILSKEIKAKFNLNLN